MVVGEGLGASSSPAAAHHPTDPAVCRAEGPGFGELHSFRAPVTVPFSRDWPWCKKQFHCFWIKEMPQNCLNDL